MDGGTGTHTVDYSFAAAGVSVSLSLATKQRTGGGGIDTLFRIENLVGSNFVDLLTGTGAANVLTGLAGDDDLNGLGAATRLTAAMGRQDAAATLAEALGGARRDIVIDVAGSGTFSRPRDAALRPRRPTALAGRFRGGCRQVDLAATAPIHRRRRPIPAGLQARGLAFLGDHAGHRRLPPRARTAPSTASR